MSGSKEGRGETSKEVKREGKGVKVPSIFPLWYLKEFRKGKSVCMKVCTRIVKGGEKR